jgi:hypothetical protein
MLLRRFGQELDDPKILSWVDGIGQDEAIRRLTARAEG